MCPRFQSSDNMFNGRLASLRIQRTYLKQHVSFRPLQPLSNISRRMSRVREVSTEHGNWIECHQDPQSNRCAVKQLPSGASAHHICDAIPFLWK